MRSSVARSAGPIHLGLDVGKNKIAVGVLRWDEQVPDVEAIINDEASVRRLIDRFADRRRALTQPREYPHVMAVEYSETSGWAD